METKMKVFTMDGVSLGELEVVGNYGTFDAPIVLVDGIECVAEPYFCNASGVPVAAYCQSAGCDFCCGSHAGCRNGEFAKCEVKYCI